MQLGPLGACLTAAQPKLGLASTDDCLHLGAKRLQAAHFGSRQGQASGGVVLGAVSDDQDLQTTGQPAALCPIRVAPISPEGWPMAPTILLQPAHELPPLVAHPSQERPRRLPGVDEDGGWAAAQAVARLAEQLQRQGILR